MQSFKRFMCVLVLGLGLNGELLAKEVMVESQAAFKAALSQIEAGDTIVLKNGTWSDFEIGFFAEGRADSPVTLRAETPGKVILSGLSNLRLAGNYLVVEGLVFKNGYTPTGEVISFKRDDTHLANYSRVTQVVIDSFNNPDRDSSDYWVVLYGKHNRFDHSYLAGKRNLGVTMAVRLNTEASQQNYHRIDHNYFGHRPILGSNGGETLRVGTSTFSLTDSHTLIENNYFDRCDGEVEIVSIKSGKNIVRNNVFYESRGALALRHGNGNLVEGNVFLGNGAEHTGGIRVINSDQVVRNNYLEGLTGTRFGSGFAVMNGAQGAAVHRYAQVVNATIENNTFINVDTIQLGAGSDAERNAPPANSRMQRNLFVSDSTTDVFQILDDMSGISFADNLLHKVNSPKLGQGFSQKRITLKRNAAGLLVPQGDAFTGIGASSSLQPIKKSEVGPQWYEKAIDQVEFDSGKTIAVAANEEDALFNAIKQAKSGDQLVLAPGSYKIAKLLEVNKTLSIRSKKAGTVVLLPERTTLFEIQNGGSLKLSGITIDGSESPDMAGSTLIRTLKSGMYISYRLLIENSRIENLNVNHSHHVLDAGSRSLAEKITIVNSVFKNITGDLLRLDKEIDDLGNYNVETLVMEKNNFANIDGALITMYRGGTDESTFGPHLLFKGNTVAKVGQGSRNKRRASVYLHGVQFARLSDNQFDDTAGIVIEHTVGDPDTELRNNRFIKVPALQVAELHTKGESTVKYINNREIHE